MQTDALNLLRNGNIQTISDMNLSRNAAVSKADITNAPHLFGDVFEEDGDPDDSAYGDWNSAYGDVELNENALGLFNAMYGDPDYGDAEEEGSPLSFIKKHKGTAGLASGAALGIGGSLLIKKLQRAARAKRARRAAAESMVIRNSRALTNNNARNLARYPGKIDRKAPMPFFNVTGASMTSAPISPDSTFVADQLKWALDSASNNTPFYQEVTSGVLVGTDFVNTLPGVVAARFYAPLLLRVGLNTLSAIPGLIIEVTMSIPTVNGLLSVTSAAPFIFSLREKNYMNFLFYPWQLVANKAMLLQGSYNNANNIVVTVSNLPATAYTSLSVFGTLDKRVVALRNAFVRK